MLSAVSEQYGSATVIQIDRDGHTFGNAFTVHDPFDVHLPADAEGTAYLNFNYQWVFIPSTRHVKYVTLLDSTAETDKWEVREQDRHGSGWGESFYAWAVDSV